MNSSGFTIGAKLAEPLTAVDAPERRGSNVPATRPVLTRVSICSPNSSDAHSLVSGSVLRRKILVAQLPSRLSIGCSSLLRLRSAGRFCVAMMLAWLEPRERSKKSESLVSLSVVKKTWNSSQKKKLGRGFAVPEQHLPAVLDLEQRADGLRHQAARAIGKCT
jgi:hypothetical protein